MKKLFGFLVILGLFFSITHSVFAYTSVKGYYRSNGTYVQPHVRSSPNALKYDNYSYKSGDLYNKSYYAPTKNHPSSWNTPSWYTDSSYYSGKVLYNSYNY